MTTMLALEDLAQPLQNQIQTLKLQIKKLKHQKTQLKLKGITTARQTHARLINLLKSFKDCIDLYDTDQVDKYKQEAKQYQTSLNEILQQIDYYQSQGRTQKELFDGKKNDNEEDLDNADLKRLIEIGRKYQTEGIDALIRAERYLHQGIDIADEVNLTLDQQIEQLDRIYNTVKDADSKMNRAIKFVNYFAKQVYTDKCLMVMIGLVITAIIVVVILTAVGVGGGKTTVTDQLT